LSAEAHVGVLVEGLLAGRIDVSGLEGDRLVAVILGQLDAAVEIAMVHVRAPEDDEARLEHFLVGHKRHDKPRTVQIPCRSRR
jgi:hypothetical protein